MSGDFVWYDVMTSDPQAAQDFYTAVVGWNGQLFPGSEPPYRVQNLPSGGDRGVAGVMPMPEGARPMWSGYIHVDDVDAAAKAVAEAGGALHKGPWDVEGVGRMAVAADPQGAMFMLFKPTPPPGMPEPAPVPEDATGSIGWRELMTTDWQGAFDFYAKVFGWSVDYDFDMGEHGIYRIFSTPGQPRAGGMMNKPAGNPAPTAWGFYFRVDGIDAGAQRIKDAGGQIIMGPMPVPDGQFVVVGIDPQGAAFGLLSRTQ